MLVRTLRAARPQLSQLRCASAVPQTSPDATLKETLTAQIPQKQEELKQLKADHGSKVLGEVTVDQCIGGGRGVRCMLWETSLLDAAEGIRFRGYTIPECQELLPTFKGPAGDGEPTPEAILWLLLTGEIPTKEQCDGLTAELFERSALPAHATQLLDSLPKTMHPMTQFSLGLQAYRCGVLYTSLILRVCEPYRVGGVEASPHAYATDASPIASRRRASTPSKIRHRHHTSDKRHTTQVPDRVELRQGL